MRPKLSTPWNLKPLEAIRLQERLAKRVELEDRLGPIRTIAAADIAFDPATNIAFASVIVYRFPDLVEIERRRVRRKLRFPYIPGLLSFRECPILLAAFARLKTSPDVILIDGHGRAHPRRFGIACHMGVLLDRPAIGCGKSLLVGKHREPGKQRGATAPLIHKDEQVGVALRTRDDVKPIYVSQGNRVSLPTAVKLVKHCLDGFRIPKPIRDADRDVRDLRRAFQRRSAVRKNP
jgi:deoxyribonuclease V